MNKIDEIEKFIDEQIERIDDDERYHYKPALVQINAPLALIQVEMGGMMKILQCVKKIIEKGE